MTHRELEAAGVEVSPAAYERLARFVALLLEENTRINLTAIRNPAAAWRLHICDSLAVLPWLRRCQPQRVLDLGSGGGLPGLPLACANPEVQFTLLDATRKKVDALQRMIGALALPNARALWGRAETLVKQPEHGGQFDIVTARAVAALPRLLGYAAGFLRPGGQLWLYQSAAGAAPRSAAAAAAPAGRLREVQLRAYRVPGDDHDRVLLAYEKTG